MVPRETDSGCHLAADHDGKTVVLGVHDMHAGRHRVAVAAVHAALVDDLIQ